MQKHNAYSSTFPALFEEIPKTVLAAVAASFGTTGGDHLEQAAYRIAREWETLYNQGIIPQPLTSAARKAITDGAGRGYTSAFGGE